MKPKWSTAPDWANWVAMDDNGVWYWFAEKRKLDLRTWRAQSGQWKPCNEVDAVWKNTLEGRM